MKYYMVVFNEDGRSVSPLLPVRADQVERTLGTLDPPVGYLQIDREGLEMAGSQKEPSQSQELNMPPVEEDELFQVQTPLDLTSILNRKSLNTVWVEVPSDMALKYISQNKGLTYTDQMFVRIKLANPDRYLESIGYYLQSRNLNIGVKENYILISIPNFIDYQGVLEIGDTLCKWFEDQNLTVVRNRIDLYAVDSGEAGIGPIVYLSATSLPFGITFFEDFSNEEKELDKDGDSDQSTAV